MGLAGSRRSAGGDPKICGLLERVGFVDVGPATTGTGPGEIPDPGPQESGTSNATSGRAFPPRSLFKYLSFFGTRA